MIYAYALADRGYRQFPFGDNAVLNIWQAESTTPYAVSQATGFFATIPDFLDSQHPIETCRRRRGLSRAPRATSRWVSTPRPNACARRRAQSDPARLPARHDAEADDRFAGEAGGRVDLVIRWRGARTPRGIAGDWAAQAAADLRERDRAGARPARSPRYEAARPKATHDAGVWRLPDGEAFYA